MRTIFERLVEELRAWHLFEDSKDYSLSRELPGTSLPERGKSSRHRRDPVAAPAPPRQGAPR